MPIQPRIEADSGMDGPPGVRVFDPIERQEYRVQTSQWVDPSPVSVDRFEVPINVAVRITTSSLRLPDIAAVYVHDAAGEMVAEAQHLSSVELPAPDERDASSSNAGPYSIELLTPVKLYLRVDASVRITSGAYTELTFGVDTTDASDGADVGSPTTIELGARSYHEHPATTIRSPSDPASLMKAVSYFGSALKTTTSERAYPTLRGHPPLLELDDNITTVEVTDELRIPETGIEIHVPTTRTAVYAVTSLAYYLGATVRPLSVSDRSGTTAEHRNGGAIHATLTTPKRVYPLLPTTGTDTLHAAANRLLRHVLTLDCCTRTEGIYSLSLAERTFLDECDEIDLDFAALYDRPIDEQVDAYLSVPFDVVERVAPVWELEVSVTDDVSNAKMLPFIADALAFVKPGTPFREQSLDVKTRAGGADDAVEDHDADDDDTDGSNEDREERKACDAIDSFFRGRQHFRSPTDSRTGRGPSRDADESEPTSAFPVGSHETIGRPSTDIRGPSPTAGAPVAAAPRYEGFATSNTEQSEDVLARTWVGPIESVPPGRSWTTLSAHQNSLARADSEGPLEIAVVINDERMCEESQVVDDVYRAGSPFDVTVHRNLTCEELVAVLEANLDLLHYIGHIRAGGIECANGFLDAHELETVGVDAFFLNACTSDSQGIALIERGSVAGVVTSAVVSNAGATRLGATFARLLDAGFSVFSALNIARLESTQGQYYRVVGDGQLAVSQAESGAPQLAHVTPTEVVAEEFEVKIEIQSGTVDNVGSIYMPHLSVNDQYFLCYGLTDTFHVGRDELRRFFQSQNFPVYFDGELRWSFEFDL